LPVRGVPEHLRCVYAFLNADNDWVWERCVAAGDEQPAVGGRGVVTSKGQLCRVTDIFSHLGQRKKATTPRKCANHS